MVFSSSACRFRSSRVGSTGRSGLTAEFAEFGKNRRFSEMKFQSLEPARVSTFELVQEAGRPFAPEVLILSAPPEVVAPSPRPIDALVQRQGELAGGASV